MSTADTWLGFDRVRPVFNASTHYTTSITADSKLLSTTSSGRHRGIDFGTWRNSKSTVDGTNVTSMMCRNFTFFFLSGSYSTIGTKKRIDCRQAGQLGRKSWIRHYKSGIDGPRVSNETDTRFGGNV